MSTDEWSRSPLDRADPYPASDPMGNLRSLRSAEDSDDKVRKLEQLIDLPLNDVGNADRFVAIYGNQFLYAIDRGWLKWNGAYWDCHGAMGEVELAIQEMVKLFADVCVEKHTTDSEKEGGRMRRKTAGSGWGRHAKYSGSYRGVRAVERLARNQLGVSSEVLDRLPYSLNSRNATIQLPEPDSRRPSLIVLLPERDDRLSQCTNSSYARGAICPQFKTFLEQILPDPQCRKFVQRWFGYCLAGNAGEQTLVIFYGSGANGKSVLTSVIQDVLGDYCATIPVEALLRHAPRRGNEASPEILKLKKKRLVFASEPERYLSLGESRVKAMTGGEPIQARGLYMEPEEFVPQYKITLSCNTLPRISGQDEGIWRRIQVLPFDHFIPEEKRDRDLSEKVLGEGAGILNWLIAGYLDYLEVGLSPPQRVRETTDRYRAVSDSVGSFLATKTIRDSEGRVQSSELYSAYRAHCEVQEIPAVARGAFGKRVGRLGYLRTKASRSWYRGLRLLDS